MADCLVRLVLALMIIGLITATLYQFNSRRAVAFEPPTSSALKR